MNWLETIGPIIYLISVTTIVWIIYNSRPKAKNSIEENVPTLISPTVRYCMIHGELDNNNKYCRECIKE